MNPTFVTLVMRNGDRVQKIVSKGEKSLKVGRARDCEIRMSDSITDSDVSRHHCLFAINPPEVRLCDLGSRNGTFVNGSRISAARQGLSAEADSGAYSEVPLKDGDEVRVGRTTFQVLVDGPDDEATHEMGAHPN